MKGRLHSDTQLAPLEPGRFAGNIDRGWWVQSGPNGGYLSAMSLRAMLEHLDDASRPPRSLHVRFLSAPDQGAVEVEVQTLRAGRSLTTLGASMHQGGKLLLVASATFSGPFSEVAFQDVSMPQVTPIADCEPIPRQIPLNERWDMLRGIGGEFRKSPRALTGGYIRPAEPVQVDALTIAAMWDAWPPSAFARAMEQRFRGAAPTVEATLYFRAQLPCVGAQPTDYYVIRVEATTAHEGFMAESGEIWSRSGVLLAQSHQLQLLI